MTYSEALTHVPRILIEAQLKPLQGQRFQPTGFPDLGAASYTLPTGEAMLLVESPQSVANRLETMLWDENAKNVVEPWRGIPYVQVKHKSTGQVVTNSILEAHRLNSPYILEGGDKSFSEKLKSEFQAAFVPGPEGPIGAIDMHQVAATVFKYDPNCLIHGVFLAKKDLANGRVKIPRLLSSFIEASDARPAESGGVKNDRINPSGNTKSGYGNVPFHRTEYVAGSIVAYFNLDLALLRSYGLGNAAEELLLALSLWKIRKFLDSGLRLRTACDLQLTGEGLAVTSPDGFTMPAIAELERNAKSLVNACQSQFANPPITEVIWDPAMAKSKNAGKGKDEEGNGSDADSEGDSQ